MMPTFVNQSGAPLVNVQSQCQGDTSKVTLSQRRYSYDRNFMDSDSNELWMIPVSLKTIGHAAKDETVLLTARSQTFDLPGCNSWIFGNAGAQGYYRSGYDSEAFQSMSRNVGREFTPAERIVLIRDVWAAVRTGKQPIVNSWASMTSPSANGTSSSGIGAFPSPHKPASIRTTTSRVPGLP